MKCILDAFLVLTKQDRQCIQDYYAAYGLQKINPGLCHVIHATSDPFYQTWLRQLNVMQHCKVRRSSLMISTSLSYFQIISLGDCSKEETRIFFHDRLLPSVPKALRAGLEFEELYSYFGGKLVHWNDYITDYGRRRISFL
jgi:hypothetical protein